MHPSAALVLISLSVLVAAALALVAARLAGVRLPRGRAARAPERAAVQGPPAPVPAPAPASASRPAVATGVDGNGSGTGESARLAEDLAHDRAELDERMRRAERADRLRNLLISKMSHDIRTPLNSVLTLSQLLGEGTAGPLSFEQRKYVEIIHRNSRTLLGLVGDILDLASLEAGRMELEPHPFDLRALLRAVADACGRAAQ